MTSTERTAWLEERRRGMGATDVANLVRTTIDEEPFATPLQIWRSKIEPVSEQKDEPRTVMLMGLATEDLNAQLYAKRMDVEVTRPAPISRHDIHSWACASLDRLAAVRPLELKYTPFFSDAWGDELTDEIPHGYIVQTQWQMACIAVNDFADVSGLSGTGEHRIYRVGFDARFVQMLLDIAGDFWHKFVLTATPPPDDWMHPATTEIAEACERVTANKSLVLGDDAVKLATEYTALKQIRDETEAEIELRKSKLLGMMGDAQKAFAGTFKLSRALIEGKNITPEPYYRKPSIRFTLSNPKGK